VAGGAHVDPDTIARIRDLVERSRHKRMFPPVFDEDEA
jgi:hypothetical protein